MKTQVMVFDQDGLPAESVIVEAGEKRVVTVTSPYLVSAGQKFQVSVAARPIAPRGLLDIIGEIRLHVQASPTHGYNCICMDNLIREVRGMVREGVTTAGSRKRKIVDEDGNVAERVRYILLTALEHV